MCHAESLVKVFGLFYSSVVLKANHVQHAGPNLIDLYSYNRELYLAGS